MEDSLESEVVLVVPPSIEDSDPSMMGGDNLLGISTRPSESSDASFSCFQLSGRGVESQSESSESLHIDDVGGDIIPSSPGVMHIELANTPSADPSVPGSSTTGSHEYRQTSDMDSGRMSPELIPSSDISSVDMMSSNPRSHRSSSLSSKEGDNPHDAEEKTSPHQNENPFEIDTETYSPSKYLRTPEKDQEQAPSSYTFLQKISSIHPHPSPVILTASTQEDSENRGKNDEKTMAKAEEFIDIDSKEIMIKDVEMRSVEEENSPKNELNNSESDPLSPPEAEEPQVYTQEDLNLHLTFESQLFGTSSLPNADSQVLVIDEQSQSHNTAISIDVSHNSTDLEKPNIDSPMVDAAPNSGQRDNGETICEDESHLLHGRYPHDSQILFESQSLNGSGESHPGNPTSDSKEDTIKNRPEEKSQTESTVLSSSATATTRQHGGTQESLTLGGTFAPSVSTSVLIEGSSSSDRSQSLTNNANLPSQFDSAAVELKSSQDISMLSTIPTDVSQMEIATSSSTSVRMDALSASTKADEDEKDEVSPSMQSTYVDENNNQAASQPTNATNDQSLESVMSSQPTAASYDASVENSSLESVTDMIALPLGDLETQPYSLSATEETMEVNPDSEDSQSRQTGRNSEESELKVSDAENEIRPLINELIDQAVARTARNPTPTAEATVDIAELLGSNLKGQSLDVCRNDIGSDKDQLDKTYDYRSQSQPSQDIHLKSAFRSPSNPPVRERSGTGRRRRRSERGRRKTQMDKDQSNDADTPHENAQNEEHDKSSDTLPPDDGSGQDSDHLLSPAKENLSYRVSKTIVVETICNGKVIHIRTLPKKVKIVQTNPYQTTSSQSSNGSGYLADTSSISRTSSDSSTQTSSSHSPGSKSRCTSVPSLLRDSSGSSTASSLSTSSTFVIPGHPSKSMKSPKEAKHQPSTSSPSEKATSPIVVATSPQSATTTPSQSICMSSPPLKKSIVLLTPLSEELIAASTGTLGSNFTGDIATPPTTNINPPLSGSTPVETQKELTSDVETSNSPEIPYPDDSVQGTIFQFNKTPTSEKKKSPKRSLNDQTPDMLSFGEGIPVMARIPTESYFYPGLMRAQDPSSGKYSVYFEDDEKERMIRESDVLLIDKLNVGQEVFVQSDSDDPSHWYSAGKILSHWRENDERGYVIERSDLVLNKKEGRRYSRKSVIVRQEHLTKEQKLSRVQPPSVAMYDVSLDNIVDGKRRTRRSRFNSPATSSPSSSRPNTPSPSSSKTPKSSRKRRISDSQSSGSSSCVPFPSTKKSKRAKLTFGPKTPSKKRSSPAVKAETMYKESKIFENCTFLLTSTTGRDQPSSEFESPPSEPTSGYDRPDTLRKILAGSGIVAKNFTELMSSDRDHRYVVSDNFCRTMNYLSALGAGIECLSFLFINNSLNVGKLKTTVAYKLPAGYSLQHQSVVERPSVHVQPLSGLRIHLQMKDIATWSPLLILSGCETVSSRQNKMKDECPLMCDVVVADSSCTSALKERAKLLKIPVVSIEWVIQCLITSEKLPFYGHPQYTVFK